MECLAARGGEVVVMDGGGGGPALSLVAVGGGRAASAGSGDGDEELAVAVASAAAHGAPRRLDVAHPAPWGARPTSIALN